MAILNNDHQLTALGYSEKKSIYYDELKKRELEQRGVIKQLRMFRKMI